MNEQQYRDWWRSYIINGLSQGRLRCKCGARFGDFDTLMIHCILRTTEQDIFSGEPLPHVLDHDDPSTWQAYLEYKAVWKELTAH